jgi:hypothetical protein
MLVYITPLCREHIDGSQDAAVIDRVEELAARIRETNNRLEADQLWQFRDRGRQKQRIGKWRLLGKFVNVGEETVCVFLVLWGRGSDEYEKEFLRDRNLGAVDAGLNMEDLRKWVAEQLTTSERVRAPRLPDNLEKWLQAPTEIAPEWGEQDTMIYEAESWVRDVLGSQVRNRLESLSEIVLSLMSREEHIGQHGWQMVVNEKRTLAVIFSRPSSSVVFLGRVIANDLGAADHHLASFEENPIDYVRRARRAYPAYLLADLDLWTQIQNGETSNLSLSPEEHQLLKVMGQAGPEGHEMPMFINGRAGSGKSTMLMYAFAGLYVRKIVGNLDGQPLFITYGGGLKEKARQGVHKLLRTNHQFLVDAESLENLDESFVEFRDFLLGYLTASDRSRFGASARVGYHEFKRAFLGMDGRLKSFMAARPRGVSPEIAWFVIRSLIKGASGIEGELDLEGFDNLDRRDKVVTREIFESVLSNVYEPWYRQRMQEAGLWDDQDLVTAALESGRDSGRQVAAIICDEAQDFTRKELRLLVRACKLMQYDLSRYGARVRLPFVFAGDPLQTISPTGFRWEQFTSAMFEEVRVVADEATGRKELTINYRSTGEIVLAANAIQLLRMSWLRIPDIEPQEPWVDRGEGESDSPRRFTVGAGVTLEQFEELTKDAVIIVPCEESGEEEYVRNDPTLSQIYFRQGSTSAIYNIFSSSAAKGLEFPKVVVFGFGNAVPQRPKNLKELDPDDDALFQLKHFFNKLYVAVTRAERNLYFVDNVGCDEDFWSELDGGNLIAHAGSTVFKDKVEAITVGTSSDFETLRGGNPLENAEKLAASGRANGIATQLRQAAGYYRRANRLDLSRRCEADAMFIERRFQDAGEVFRELGDTSAAWTCYWESCNWEALAELRGLGVVGDASEWDAVRFMLMGTDSECSIVNLAASIGHHLEREGEGFMSGSPWSKVAERLVETDLSRMTLDERRSVATLMRDVSEVGLAGAGDVSAKIFFELGDYAVAAELWSRHPSSDRVLPILARARVAGFPEGLEILSQASLHAEIVNLWEAEGKPLGKRWLEWVAPALLKVRPVRTLDAARACIEMGNYLEAANLIDQLSRENSNGVREVRLRVAGHAGSTRDLRLIRLLVNPRTFRGPVQEQERPDVIRATVTALVRQAMTDDLWGKKVNEPDLADLLVDCSSDGVSLSPLVFGAAIESCGNYVKALRFYESLAQNDDPEIRTAARLRWAQVKNRQIEDSTPMERGPRESDRKRQLKDWKMDERSLSLSVVPPVSRLLGAAKSEISREDGIVVNFLESGVHGSLSWDVGDRGLVLTWDDENSFGSVRIEIESRKVRPETGIKRTGVGLEVPVGAATASVDFVAGRITVLLPRGETLHGPIRTGG